MTLQTSQSPFIAASPPDDSWRTYYDLLRRWWWAIALGALLAGAAGWLVSAFQTPIYGVTVKLLINQASSPDNVYQDILTSERVAQTYATWMNQDSFVVDTFRQLGLATDPDFIAAQIAAVSVTPLRNSQIIELSVEGPSPELIVAFARTLPPVFARAVQAVQTSRFAETKASLTQRLADLSKQIETTQNALNALGPDRSGQQDLEYNRLAEELARLRANYGNLSVTYEQLLLTEAQTVDTIAVIQEAKLPGSPLRPRPLRNTALAFVVGALMVAGLAFLYEMVTDRFRSQDDVRLTLGLPVLGSIGQIGKFDEHTPASLIAVNDPRALAVEAFRRLRTNLRFADVDAELTLLAVTSANPEEGKSLVSANLAVVMAQSGISVLLIDADLRKPKQHHLFGLSRSPGLTDGLLTDSLDNLAGLVQPTQVPGLTVLTAGNQAPNPAELLGSRRMAQLFTAAKAHADIVIVDTPPIMAVTDAQLVAAQVDGTLLVLDHKRTTRKAARHAVELLDQVNARIVGLAINRLTSSDRGYYYSYYDYDYYYDDPEEDAGSDPEHAGHGARGKRRKTKTSRRAVSATQP